MINLYIDGQEAFFPADAAVTIKRENPFLTDGGDITLDITLAVGANFHLYGDIARLNTLCEMPSRQADLYVDGRLVMRGTEKILSISEEEASIQLLSGNSELNGKINNTLTFGQLWLGPVPEMSAIEVCQSWLNYAQTGIVAPPVLSEMGEATVVVNNAGDNLYQATAGVYDNNSISIQTNIYANIGDRIGTLGSIRPMLMLWRLLELLFRELGFEIGANALKVSKYAGLYLCTVKSLSGWRDIFPADYKVTEFLDEVEKLLDIRFDINSASGVVDIVFRGNHLTSQAEDAGILDIVDDWVKSPIENPSKTVSNSNVRYDIDSDSDFWKRQLISDDVLREITIYATGEIDFYTPPTLDWKYIIARDYNFDDCWTGHEFNAEGVTTSIVGVNAFRPRRVNSSGDFVRLKLDPAEIRLYNTNFVVYDYELGINNSYIRYTQFPFVPGLGNNGETERQTVDKLLSDGLPERDETPFSLAFFDGMKRAPLFFKNSGWIPTVPFYYPLSFVHYNAIGYYDRAEPAVDTTKVSLLLNGASSLKELHVDSNTFEIDYTHEYKMRPLFGGTLPDPKRVYSIRNKLFVCRELTISADGDGFKPIFEGVFYEVKEK